MVHDKQASDTASEPDSPGDDDILYIDWQSPAGAKIEASIDRSIWPNALVNSFQHTAPKIFDDILVAHDSPPASVSLCLCDDLHMQQINRQHRQIDKSTNVLSFPAYDMLSHRLELGAIKRFRGFMVGDWAQGPLSRVPSFGGSAPHRLHRRRSRGTRGADRGRPLLSFA